MATLVASSDTDGDDGSVIVGVLFDASAAAMTISSKYRCIRADGSVGVMRISSKFVKPVFDEKSTEAVLLLLKVWLKLLPDISVLFLYAVKLSSLAAPDSSFITIDVTLKAPPSVLLN